MRFLLVLAPRLSWFRKAYETKREAPNTKPYASGKGGAKHGQIVVAHPFLAMNWSNISCGRKKYTQLASVDVMGAGASAVQAVPTNTSAIQNAVQKNDGDAVSKKVSQWWCLTPFFPSNVHRLLRFQL